jgi:uncharacterized protein with NRDE domain
MCTLALYLRQFENYPLIVAANRDEHFSRPTASPEMWRGDPPILAGKDLAAGGTWLGVNSARIAAAVVNRRVKTEDIDAPRSRGLLCLDMLHASTMADARAALPYEDAGRYQPFLLVLASAEGAFAAYNAMGDIATVELRSGLHVFGNTSFTDEKAQKLDRARHLFAAAAERLAPLLKDDRSLDSAVDVLKTVLSDHTPIENGDGKSALCVHAPDADYGTVSSSIIFLSSRDRRFHFYHSLGPPCRTEFHPLPPLAIV